MAFHPQYWNNALRNGSRRYNYYEWNRTSRFTAAQHVKTDARDQPKPEEPVQLEPQVRVVPEVGGVMIFSANQLHSTVPNTSGRTRFSIDFRTVNLDDVLGRQEAPNVDSECTGTSLRDFLRARDFERIAEEVVLTYEGLTPTAQAVHQCSPLPGGRSFAIDRGQTTRSKAVRGAILNRSEMHRVLARFWRTF
jgi:hypothetical protein